MLWVLSEVVRERKKNTQKPPNQFRAGLNFNQNKSCSVHSYALESRNSTLCIKE
jgi:hypothetical protein